MSKRQKKNPAAAAAPRVPPRRRGPGPVPLATLAAVGLVTVVSVASWREITRLRSGLDARFERIESRIDEVADKVEESAKAQPVARRGPDPDRVYEVRTDGAPFKGPATAPITIVEFSDFQ